MAVDVHTIGWPVEVRPTAPAGAQYAPGVTPATTTRVVVVVVGAVVDGVAVVVELVPTVVVVRRVVEGAGRVVAVEPAVVDVLVVDDVLVVEALVVVIGSVVVVSTADRTRAWSGSVNGASTSDRRNNATTAASGTWSQIGHRRNPNHHRASRSIIASLPRFDVVAVDR